MENHPPQKNSQKFRKEMHTNIESKSLVGSHYFYFLFLYFSNRLFFSFPRLVANAFVLLVQFVVNNFDTTSFTLHCCIYLGIFGLGIAIAAKLW